jgi:hypothetical protein
MIFISHSLVTHTLLGAPPDWIMHKLFPLITRKTFKNWKHKPLRLIPSTREKMAESVKRFAPDADQRFDSCLSDVLDMDISDEALESIWSSNLRSLQKGLLTGMCPSGVPEDAFIFPEPCLVELESLERACFRLNERLQADDFDEALSLIRNQFHDFPLFQKKYVGTRWPENVPDLLFLKKAMWFSIIDSLLYLVALLDVSFSRTEEGFLREPYLLGYLPPWKNGQWSSPMRAWFDELKKQSHASSLDEVAEAVATALGVEFDVARRHVYRWRKGKPKLPWERMLKIVRLIDLDEGKDFGLIIQYGIAHVLHEFHDACLEHGMPSEELSMMYAGYGDWYRHHLALAENTAPAWQWPSESGAAS